MSKNVTIFVDLPEEKPDEQPKVHKDWPQLIEDEEPSIVTLTFECRDLRTKKDPEDPDNWIDIPDLNGAVSLLNSDQYDAEDCGQFLQTPRRIYTDIYCNEPTVPSENLVSEFGENNPDRWERKPIKFVSARDDDGRWTLSGDYNIRMQLKAGDNVKIDISPDLNEDDAVVGTGSLRLNLGTDQTPGSFKWTTPPRGGLHLTMSDIGTKSQGHYLTRNGVDCDYGNDWLDTSVFFCPFDTSDKDNFKITTELDYEADEYTGTIIKSASSRKYQLYLMPRTVALYARYRGHKSNYLGAYQFTFPAEYDGVYPTKMNPNDSAYAACNGNKTGSCYEWIIYPGGCCARHQSFADNNCCCVENCIRPIAVAIGWAGEVQIDHYYVSGGLKKVTGNFTYGTVGGGVCSISGSWGSPQSVPDGPTGYVNNGVFLISFQINRTRKTILHNVGIWYDRLPNGFALGSPGSKITSPTVRIASANVEVSQLWGDESKSQAIANMVAAGGSADDVIGGFNSFHVFRGENIYMVFADCDGQMERKPVFRSLPNHKPLDTLGSCGVGECYQINATDKFALIWDKIKNSNFWTRFGKDGNELDSSYTYTGTEYDSTIPIAFGLVESREGDLVAIIKAGGRPFYVWRKTQENFTVRQLGVQGDCSLEEYAYDTDDWDLGFSAQDSGSGRKRDKVIINPVLEWYDDPECCPYEEGGCGMSVAVCTLVPGYPSESGVQDLPAPVFVIGAREYATLASKRALNIENCKSTYYTKEKRNSM